MVDSMVDLCQHEKSTWILNKAFVDNRLRPRSATHDKYLMVFIVEQILVGISNVMPVFYSRLEMHITRHMTIVWKHDVFLQNRKYLKYRNAARGGPSHDRRQHEQKIWWSSVVSFSSYASGQTDRHTYTNHTSQYFARAKVIVQLYISVQCCRSMDWMQFIFAGRLIQWALKLTQ